MRLITAYEGGREVDLKSVLSHELMPVSLSLAEINGSLRTGNKSVLIDKLTDGINCPDSIDLHGKTAYLIIGGQALVVSLGKLFKWVNATRESTLFLTAIDNYQPKLVPD